MRFIKWLLGIVLLLVIVLAIGGYVFLKTFDLNKYKSYAEKIVYEQTGRKLSVKGDASLGVSLIPTLIISDVSLSNPSWAQNPQMVKIGSLELKFSLLPLLKKQVVVDKAVISDAQIYLETAQDGKNNWTFEPIKKAQSVDTAVFSGHWLIGSAHAQEVSAAPAFLSALSDVVAREVALKQTEVQYRAADSKPLKLEINRLNFSTEGLNAPMNIGWDLVFDGMNTTGKGVTGSLAGLFDAHKAWPADVEMTAVNVKASVQAKLYDVMNKLRAEFAINVYNPAGNFNAPETTLIATGKADLKSVLLNISSLNVVNNVIFGSVDLDLSDKLPYIRADLQSDKLDLRLFNRQSPTAFVLPSLISSAHASELVPNDKIPYDLLKTVNGNVALRLGQLIVDDSLVIDDVRLTALLKNGILNINPLELHFGQGAAEIVATVNANARSLALKINTKDIVLQNIHKEFRVDNSSDFGIVAGGESVLSADLNGRGDTYRALVNSLSGHMVVIVDKSTLQTGRFSWLANGFVSQLLNVLRIDTQKAEKIDLKCAVVRADIRNGKVNFPKGIAIDSEKLTVVSGGTLNLQNDKLKLSLNAHRNGLDGIGIVQALSNLIEIGGTLQNPKVVLDKSGALRTIAGVAAGPAYAGVGLLLDRDSAPCYTALKGTAWQTRFPKPSGVSGAAQNAYDGVSDAAQNAYDGVSGAAQNAYDGVSGAAQNAYDGVSGMASQGAEATKDAAKAFGNGARNLINNFLK